MRIPIILTSGTLALFAAITAQAHIGWTKEQVSAYYTNAAEQQWINPDSLPGSPEASFSCRVNNVWVWLSFLNGKVGEIHYYGKTFSPAEVEALLKKNGTSIKAICPPNAEEKLQLAWKDDSTHPGWEHLIDRENKEIVPMAANHTDWQHSIDWVPTAGVSVLRIQTYEYYTMFVASSAAWAAKNAAAEAAAEKSTEGL